MIAAYLIKPVKPTLLYDCLCTLMGSPQETPEAGPAPIVTRHTLAENNKRRLKILLVEDNFINQKVAIKILNNLGYNADIAANGREALEALQQSSYHLVLMDCQMPEMDGYEATAQIRNPDSKVLDHKVPVVAMTANAMIGDREKCIAAGMDDYLSKPVNPRELSDILEKYLVRHPSLQ